MSAQPQQYDPKFAPAWRPAPNETLTGTIAALDVRNGGYGAYPILTLTRGDGARVSIHAYHAVLSAKLAELGPTVGERIEITYLGQVQKADGKGAYHKYEARMPDRPPRCPTRTTIFRFITSRSRSKGARMAAEAIALQRPVRAAGLRLAALASRDREIGPVLYGVRFHRLLARRRMLRSQAICRHLRAPIRRRATRPRASHARRSARTRRYRALRRSRDPDPDPDSDAAATAASRAERGRQ